MKCDMELKVNESKDICVARETILGVLIGGGDRM